MRHLENVVSDRGSKYAVRDGRVVDRDGVDAFLKQLKRRKKYARATHDTWAVLLESGPLKTCDGEGGAGQINVQMLEREGLRDHILVVSRWYGGKHLGGDRFRHVVSCVRAYLDDLD